MFLNFVSARSRLPATADAFDTPFKIQQAVGDAKEHPDKAMPQSSTCFFSLRLPKYSTKDIMRKKILYVSRLGVARSEFLCGGPWLYCCLVMCQCDDVGVFGVFWQLCVVQFAHHGRGCCVAQRPRL